MCGGVPESEIRGLLCLLGLHGSGAKDPWYVQAIFMRLLHLQVFHSLIEGLKLLIHGLVDLSHLDLDVSLVNQLLLDGGISDAVFQLLGFKAWGCLVRCLAWLLNAYCGCFGQ